MDSPNTLRDSAERLRLQAFDQIHSVANDGKTRVSATLDGLVQAAHEIADRLGDDATSPVARYARNAAGAVDELANAIRDKSIDELVDDSRDVVRKSPMIAIGVAVAAGFALSRFLKATDAPDPAFARRVDRQDA